MEDIFINIQRIKNKSLAENQRDLQVLSKKTGKKDPKLYPVDIRYSIICPQEQRCSLQQPVNTSGSVIGKSKTTIGKHSDHQGVQELPASLGIKNKFQEDKRQRIMDQKLLLLKKEAQMKPGLAQRKARFSEVAVQQMKHDEDEDDDAQYFREPKVKRSQKDFMGINTPKEQAASNSHLWIKTINEKSSEFHPSEMQSKFQNSSQNNISPNVRRFERKLRDI